VSITKVTGLTDRVHRSWKRSSSHESLFICWNSTEHWHKHWLPKM